MLDAEDFFIRPVLQAIASQGSPQEAFADLTLPGHRYSQFWQAVRATMPVVLFDNRFHRDGFHGPYCHTIRVDFLRAAQFGWRPRQTDSPILRQRPVELDVGGSSVSVGVQTMPKHWPSAATPLDSSSVPVLSPVQGCRPIPLLCPEGPLYNLACPQFQTVCSIPCLPDHHLWAVRLSAFVYGACTTSMDWTYVAAAAEGTIWDIPGFSIIGDVQTWHWPQDLHSFSGHCGHLVHTGEDPYLCATPPFLRSDFSFPNSTGTIPVATATSRARHSHGSYVSLAACLLFGHKGVTRTLPGLVVGIWLFSFSSAGGVSLDSTSEGEDHDVDIRRDFTRTCTVAWCHELSCQTTRFSVTASELANYVAELAPDPAIRLYLWSPFQGPTVFEVTRHSARQELPSRLRALGHSDSRHLHVAFDTQGTSLDVLSVPATPTIWWIVRDGLGRELLRPVTMWVEPGETSILTLNSHGQAYALAHSPEVARLTRLPQGARAVAAQHFTRVAGQLTQHGLVLFEAAIGTVAAASFGALSRAPGFILLGLCSCTLTAVLITTTRFSTGCGFHGATPA